MPTRRSKGLTLGATRQIARNALAAEWPQLELVAVSPQHDSNFVEVMLAETECTGPPCRVLLSVDRNVSAEEFGLAVRAALRRHARSVRPSRRA